MLRLFMTAKAFCCTCLQVNPPTENKNGHPLPSALFNMLGTRTMA